jgi:hypothetical protein
MEASKSSSTGSRRGNPSSTCQASKFKLSKTSAVKNVQGAVLNVRLGSDLNNKMDQHTVKIDEHGFYMTQETPASSDLRVVAHVANSFFFTKSSPPVTSFAYLQHCFARSGFPLLRTQY